MYNKEDYIDITKAAWLIDDTKLTQIPEGLITIHKKVAQGVADAKEGKVKIAYHKEVNQRYELNLALNAYRELDDKHKARFHLQLEKDQELNK